MYEILIMGRNEAKVYAYKKNDEQDFIIISINSPSEKLNRFDRRNKNLKDILYLSFDDIIEATENEVLMSKLDAFVIKKFIDLWKEKVNRIIIHCTAGVSRSVGVACAIDRYLNSDDSDIWSNKDYTPNKWCYKLCCEAFEINCTDEDIKYKKELNIKTYNKWSEENDYIIDKMFIKEE